MPRIHTFSTGATESTRRYPRLQYPSIQMGGISLADHWRESYVDEMGKSMKAESM